jgi:hypothetical protein
MDGVAWWLLDRSQWNTIQRPSSAHHPTHAPTQQYTSTFLAHWGTQGNVPMGTTIDLSFTERRTRGHLFTIPCRWWQGLFFCSFGSGLALSLASWQLASGLARLIIIGLWMSARGGQ